MGTGYFAPPPNASVETRLVFGETGSRWRSELTVATERLDKLVTTCSGREIPWPCRLRYPTSSVGRY